MKERNIAKKNGIFHDSIYWIARNFNMGYSMGRYLDTHV